MSMRGTPIRPHRNLPAKSSCSSGSHGSSSVGQSFLIQFVKLGHSGLEPYKFLDILACSLPCIPVRIRPSIEGREISYIVPSRQARWTRPLCWETDSQLQTRTSFSSLCTGKWVSSNFMELIHFIAPRAHPFCLINPGVTRLLLNFEP